MSRKNWRWIRYFWLALVIILGAFFTTRSTEAAFFVRKISGFIPAYSDIGIISKFSLDGKYVVYSADIEMDDIYDLYSVPVRGGIPTKLSHDDPYAGREILSFVITPDSSRVIFLSDAIDDNKYELFSVSITGGTITRLNANLGNDRDVLNYFKISPDAQTVLYLADQGAYDDVFQLYSVPVTGDILIRLNQDLLSTEDVDLFELTPDGEKVVFTVKESGDNVSNLFYTPVSGDVVKILNGPLSDTHSSVQDFAVMPDNSGVIYSANQDSLYIEDVYRSDFYDSGPNPVNLTDYSSEINVSNLKISSESLRVVYEAITNPGFRINLWSILVSGAGTPQRLDSGFTPDFSLEDWKLTPNGLGVVFRIHDKNIDVYHLYSNYLDPSAPPVKLSSDLPGNQGVTLFEITPNSLGVVYLSDQTVIDKFELFSVLITGGTKIPLTPTMPGFGDVILYEITPDSQAVVLLADGISDGVHELFTNRVIGGAIAKISGPLVTGGDVKYFDISPDGKQVTYPADADIDNKQELYMVEDMDLVFLPLLTK